jgi:endonuclease/exonuclease/phosphatase family metal-dependent hydrolase
VKAGGSASATRTSLQYGPVLVRTWNLFHGNTKPPERRAFLDEMVRLAVADEPDVVCLQEVPVWALPLLDDWSGYAAVGDVAAPPTIGPLPSTAEVGRILTGLNHGLFRSAFSGQANAVLLAPRLRVLEHKALVLNPRSFRTAQARWLGLGWVARLAWAKERRVCQAVRVVDAGGRTVLLGNLHATSFPPDERLADAELLRAATWLDALARPDEPLVFAGDFNVAFPRSRTLLDLARDWGFSRPGTGIDHVLVRNATIEGPHRWPLERRQRGDRLLSDHAPVEATVT